LRLRAFVTPPHPGPAVSHIPILPEIAQAHRQLLDHHELQFDFPEFHPTPPPQWLLDLLKFLAKIWPNMSFMGYVGWGLVIIGALVIAFLVGREIYRQPWARKRRSVDDAGASEWRPELEAARNLLREADLLASQGKYAEAVHLILLRSIEDIGKHKPGLVRPAMTSREIGALRQLPSAARTTFVTIMQIVERALFAGLQIVAADFAQCREAYERFAFPGVWHGAAA
jgi:hypothetical protein